MHQIQPGTVRQVAVAENDANGRRLQGMQRVLDSVYNLHLPARVRNHALEFRGPFRGGYGKNRDSIVSVAREIRRGVIHNGTHQGNARWAPIVMYAIHSGSGIFRCGSWRNCAKWRRALARISASSIPRCSPTEESQWRCTCSRKRWNKGGHNEYS